MLYQLTYRSEARGGISDKEISQILKVSKSNNTKLGITGCLIFKGSFFLQILEGEEEVLKRLYFTIKNDLRHDNVQILHEGPSEERLFTNWDMACAKLGNQVNDHDKELQLIHYEFDRLKSDQVPESFTYKVFWYNVKQLIGNKGFYSWEMPTLT